METNQDLIKRKIAIAIETCISFVAAVKASNAPDVLEALNNIAVAKYANASADNAADAAIIIHEDAVRNNVIKSDDVMASRYAAFQAVAWAADSNVDNAIATKVANFIGAAAHGVAHYNCYNRSSFNSIAAREAARKNAFETIRHSIYEIISPE